MRTSRYTVLAAVALLVGVAVAPSTLASASSATTTTVVAPVVGSAAVEEEVIEFGNDVYELDPAEPEPESLTQGSGPISGTAGVNLGIGYKFTNSTNPFSIHTIVGMNESFVVHQLNTHPDWPQVTDEIEAVVADINATTGASLVMGEPVSARLPVPGHITVEVTPAVTCGGTAVGCTGIKIYDNRVGYAHIQIKASYVDNSATWDVVAHEMGHALGLGHYDLFHDGRYQIMRSGLTANTINYGNGDLAGFLALATTGFQTDLPVAPTAPVLTAGPRSIQASWDLAAPTTRNLDYSLEVEPSTGTPFTVSSVSRTTTIPNLNPSLTYRVRVSARNNVGIGQPSAWSAPIQPKVQIEVTGKITTTSGVPIVGARTAAYDASGESLGSISTSTQGNYRLTVTSPIATLKFYATGYVTVTVPFSGPLSPVSATAPQTATANMSLAEVVTITGTLTDPSGQPVAGHKVTLFDPVTGTAVASANSTASGTYKVTAPAPGSYQIQFKGAPTHITIWAGGGSSAASATIYALAPGNAIFNAVLTPI